MSTLPASSPHPPATAPCLARHNGYLCTKDQGHLGDHEAQHEDDGAVVATWSRAVEALGLRPTHTLATAQDDAWATPCPPWCLGSDCAGHDPARAMRGGRRHEGAALLVRQDGAQAFFQLGVNEEPHVIAGHLELRLVASSRDGLPRVAIDANYGAQRADGRVKNASFALAPMYVDEIRELVRVLQHLVTEAGAGRPDAEGGEIS